MAQTEQELAIQKEAYNLRMKGEAPDEIEVIKQIKNEKQVLARKGYQKKYLERNRQRILKYQREYRAAHKTKRAATQKAWREANK